MKTILKLAKSWRKKHVIPILSHVLLDGNTARATDINTWAECPCSVTGLNTPAAAFPWAGVEAAMKSGPLAWHDGKLNGYAVETLSAEEFPVAPTLPPQSGPEFGLTRADLQGVMLAMAHQDVRYYLNGVLIDFAAGAVVGCDGQRLHLVNGGAVVPKAPKAGQFIMQDSMAKLVSASLGKRDTARVTCHKGNDTDYIRAMIGDTVICGKAIDGRYPNYDKVYSLDAALRGTIKIDDLKPFQNVVRDAKRIDSYYGVVLRQYGAIHFGAEDLAPAVPLPGTFGKEPWIIRATAQYLMDALTFVQGKETRVLNANDQSSIVFHAGDRVAVVMPMRT